MAYTTWGPVRGGCGHLHETRGAASLCLERDADACSAHGGYSDRRIRIVGNRNEVLRYDVTLGPGKAVRHD